MSRRAGETDNGHLWLARLRPIYSEIQVGLQERAFCITDGYVFVDAPEGRWVLLVGDRSLYADERTFGIYLPEGSERRVDAILERFNALRVQESRFRGRCVTIGEKDVRYLDVDPVDWDDVVLEEHVLDEIHRNVFLPLEDSERWLASGLPLKRSLLLSGVPGTGKTMIGKLIASKISHTFIWVTADGFNRASNVRRIYQTARDNRPSVLFFEDLDVVAGRDGAMSAVFGELLGQTDGLEPNDLIITLATTNRPEALDEALKDRPGRFDRHIEIRPPSEPLRRRLFGNFMTQFHLECAPETMDLLVNRSAGSTGAHIRELVSAAAIEGLSTGWDPRKDAVLERTEEHFLEAAARLKKVRPEIGFLTGESA
jgi:SpoVK/Ycf46/Vps4 family AAA+-type ATPase